MKTKRSTFTSLALLAAVTVGCASHHPEPPKEPTVDLAEQNRMFVRMSFADNIYRGVAEQRAIYPKDFETGGAALNELGQHRVAMLIDSCNSGRGRISVLRGDATNELYDARVATVRQQLADAGLDARKVTVEKADHVENAGLSSVETVLVFNRRLTEIAKPSESSSSGVSGQMSSSHTDYSGNSGGK